MQKGRPIAFSNQALGPKAATQSTYYKEALAILQSLQNGDTTFWVVSLLSR
jgi:hypothetical protein